LCLSSLNGPFFTYPDTLDCLKDEIMTTDNIIASTIPTQSVIGFPVTAVPFDQQIALILKWGRRRLSKFVCVANVHMLTEASWDPGLGKVLHNADLVTPDGMPLVWMVRLLGQYAQDRVAGMDIMQAVCAVAPEQGVSVFFLGSEPAILELMRARLDQEFPNLAIAGMMSLPFRPLTPAEDQAVVQTLNQSGAGIVFVSLGCPKQEFWMAQHQSRVQAVMVGIGGVFPLYAGIHKRAPDFIREAGLEWLYRLVQEPRRLWKRYTTTIPPFIWLALKQLVTRQVRVPTSSRN
jgi:N-acetylglucosaminyldiphosphoundecaprenol N-acetyl-beta-D-mannosaminyltransferase